MESLGEVDLGGGFHWAKTVNHFTSLGRNGPNDASLMWLGSASPLMSPAPAGGAAGDGSGGRPSWVGRCCAPSRDCSLVPCLVM